jgi:nanoRNase/pAp phosphatase (c-di-AMP/oligoRNAs hydrolase)
MINVLNIHCYKLDKDDESAESIRTTFKNSYIVVLDTSNFCGPKCTSVADFVESGTVPSLIIDHHDPNPNVTCQYIHQSFGSCSTIMYQILKHHKIEIDNVLATALYMGISTDTDDLKSEGTTEDDEKAFAELRQIIDPEKYLKIFNYPKPLALLMLRKRFYASFCNEGNSLIVANVGVINPQQRALMAELCEEMLELEGIETSVVMGLVDEGYEKPKYLVASFRSRTLAIDTQDFIKRVFLKKDGRKNAAASGGGRKGAGAAEIKLDACLCDTLDNLAQKDDKSQYEIVVSALFETYKNRIRSEKEKI